MRNQLKIVIIEQTKNNIFLTVIKKNGPWTIKNIYKGCYPGIIQNINIQINNINEFLYTFFYN